jgi:parvulin-like peptidyl-prolyl isomerase
LAKKKQEKPRREVTRRQRSRWQQQKRRQRLILGIAVVVVVAVLSVIGVGVYQGWYVDKYKPLHEVVIEVNDTQFNMDYYVKMLGFYTQNMSVDYLNYMSGYVVQLIERNELVYQEATELGVTVSDEAVEEWLADYEPPLNDDYWDIARAALLMNKMRDDYYDEHLPLTADQRHVMAMFLESEAQVNEVAARIEAGEDFGELAAELSLDSATQTADGDLGWFPQDALPLIIDSEAVLDNAFSLEVGVLSPPIYEEGKIKAVGYWLIRVVGIDDSVDPIEAHVWAMLLGSEEEANDIIARIEAGEDFAELAGEYSLDTTSKEDGGEGFVHPGEKTTVFDDYVFGEAVELEILSAPIRDDEATTEGGYWLVEVTESEANRTIDDEIRTMLNTNSVNEWVTAIMADPENVLVDNLDDEKMQWAISYLLGG